MLYTPHFLTGVVIMKYFPNPLVGLPLTLISHVALDLVPHYDFDLTPGMNLKDIFLHDKKTRNFLFGALGIDGILTITSIIWILKNMSNPWMLILGGIIATSPDIFEQSGLLFGNKIPSIQDKFQNRVSAKYGFISYPIVLIIAFLLLLR
jgi:hypothetical protein